MNIGTAVAGVLALNGATVHIISSSEDKLKNIKQSLDNIVGRTELVEYSAVNLLDEKSVKGFVRSLPTDKTLYWVQSLGLGAGSYKLKDDNPYLPVSEIPSDLIDAELGIVKATDLMFKEFLPIFKKQPESRMALVSSMSAIRSYPYGAAHCAAKGAIDRYANALMLECYQENIFITTVRPGGVDTGMYDNQIVQETVKDIADSYACPWRTKGIRLAPPTSVGEAVKYALTTQAHTPSINLVAKGQFPHEGS